MRNEVVGAWVLAGGLLASAVCCAVDAIDLRPTQVAFSILHNSFEVP